MSQLRPLLGCIADDYTGATDVAAGLGRAGLRPVLTFGVPRSGWQPDECEAVVVALKSRMAPPREAVRRSVEALSWLEELGVEQLYFKYCSTFDSTDEGNIGVVADALMDVTGEPITVVCPASPEHGRTVYQGHLFVGDRLLSESSMRHHPLTPMTDADLVRVLSRQTRHKVALVPHAIVRGGSGSVAGILKELADAGVRYAVTDAICDDDLSAVALGARHLRILTGGAGLARNVGSLAELDISGGEEDIRGELPSGPGMILAGSCSATTLEQVACASELLPSYRIDPSTGSEPEELLAEVLKWLGRHFGSSPVLVYSSAPAEERDSGRSTDGVDIAKVLERIMGHVAAAAVDLGVRRLVVAGGETSGAVVDTLGIKSVVVAGEEDPGVPWCVTTEAPPLALLLKSGNFGRPDLFVRAVGVAP